MAKQLGQFVLVHLTGSGTFVFRYFPRTIRLEGRANWQAVDVTHDVKPLIYGNREPQRLTCDELWLDKSDTDESIGPEIVELLDLQEKKDKGTPPLLLAQWGEMNFPGVLEEISIEQQYPFTPEGDPTRARVQLTLLEVQHQRENVSVTVQDDFDTPSGRPVFGPQP